MLELTEPIKDIITKNGTTIEIREVALKEGYRPLVVDGIEKVINGVTTLDELNKKLILF